LDTELHNLLATRGAPPQNGLAEAPTCNQPEAANVQVTADEAAGQARVNDGKLIQVRLCATRMGLVEIDHPADAVVEDTSSIASTADADTPRPLEPGITCSAEACECRDPPGDRDATRVSHNTGTHSLLVP